MYCALCVISFLSFVLNPARLCCQSSQ